MRTFMTRKFSGLPLGLIGSLLSMSCGMQPARVVCGENEVLGTDTSQKLGCVPAPAGVVNPPGGCPDALTSDGQKLVCASSSTSLEKDHGVLDAVRYVDSWVADMATRLTLPLPLPLLPSYLGVTASVDGQINSANFSVFGVVAAKQICSAKFGPDAHMCTMDELYSAVANGTLKSTDTLAPSWVYMPNWNVPYAFGGTSEPLNGVADTCGGYTVHSASRHWYGVTAEWSALPDGTPGLRWHGGEDANCYSSHPIACCR